MHDMQGMYDDEKGKALRELLSQMYKLMAQGRGDSQISDLKNEVGETPEEEKMESPAEERAEEEAGSEMPGQDGEPSVRDMLKSYMGPKKGPSSSPKSATVMMAEVKAKPKMMSSKKKFK